MTTEYANANDNEHNDNAPSFKPRRLYHEGLPSAESPADFSIPSETPSYLRHLDPEQLAAALQISGPVLVNALAGSGKTTTITASVVHKIRSGIPARQILLLTFTNKAAREMLRRVTASLGTEPTGLSGGTYHRIGIRFLRKHASLVGLKNDFGVADGEDQKSLMKLALAETSGVDPKDKRLPSEGVLLEINSLSVNKGYSPAKIVIDQFPHFIPDLDDIISIVETYHLIKRRNNVLDFDDVLLFWYQILLKHPDLCARYATRDWRFIHVDEFQDTNFIQMEILKLLVSASPEKNIFAVGDANQSIYSWRGAVVDNILNFPTTFENTKSFPISYNYRSTQSILDLANASIVNNKKRSDVLLKAPEASTKGLSTTNSSTNSTASTKPYVIPTPDGSIEAEVVVSRILELRDQGVEMDRISVLYRNHFLVRDLEILLTQMNIPYQILSGVRFFEQKHIKDVLAFLRILSNPRDEIAWTRCLSLLEGVGAKTISTILDYLLKQEDIISYLIFETDFGFIKRGKQSFIDFVNLLTSVSSLTHPKDIIGVYLDGFYREYATSKFENFQDRLSDIESLVEHSLRSQSLEEFLEDVALIEDAYKENDNATDSDREKRVILTTIHKAKGLEWSHVFVIGLRDGALPSKFSVSDPDLLEEERRLFYVACTRAEKELYLLYPETAFDFQYGRIHARPSRFIKELPATTYSRMDLE